MDIFRLPNVETSMKSSLFNKNPYSFAPNFKSKNQKQPQTSDGVIVESIGEKFLQFRIGVFENNKLIILGSPHHERIHLELRPNTHPQNVYQSPVRQQKLKRSDKVVMESPRKCR
jgi:hypothetical protein